MSKGCRFFPLLAALIIGLGVLGGSNEVGAQQVQVTDVTITTPDSGVVRGIDSLIVAEVTVFDVPTHTDLTVVAFLVAEAKDTVLVEATPVGETRQDADGNDISGEAPSDLATQIRTVVGTQYNAADRSATYTADGLAAVRKIRNSDTIESTDFVGDADSVATRGVTDGAVFTWYLKVSPQLGDVKKVRVAAYAYSPTLTPSPDNTLKVVVSGASQQFSVDGDRPPNPVDVKAFWNADFSQDEATTPDGTDETTAAATVYEHTESPGEIPTTGTDRTNNPDKNDGVTVTERTAADGGSVAGRSFGYLLPTEYVAESGRADVLGFTRRGTNNPNTVLGIGDSLKLRLKLGNDVGPVVADKVLDVAAVVFGKTVPMDRGNRGTGDEGDVIKLDLLLAEDQFGTATASCCAGIDATYDHDDDNNASTPEIMAPTDTIRLVYVDAAGNHSGHVDGAVEGVWAFGNFFADTKKPALDALSKGAVGDTILPVSTDTITDGTLNEGFSSDENAIEWKLAEPLDSLTIIFSGADVKTTFGIPNKQHSLSDASLLAGAPRMLNFTGLGDFGANDGDSVQVLQRDAEGAVSRVTVFESGDINVDYDERKGLKEELDSIQTGMHTITFKGLDFGGNEGPELARENVYVDVDDIEFIRLFPTRAGFGPLDEEDRVDTLEEETSKLSFQLSEPADSVLITYLGVSGPDDEKERTRRLSGTELTRTDGGQLFPVDSLMHGSMYHLTVLGRDLAGNFIRKGPYPFYYDTTHVVPTITRFTITGTFEGEDEEGNPANIPVGLEEGETVVAGQKVTLTITADATTDGSRDAVTYRSEAVLKVAVTGSDAATTGIALEGTGVTDMGGGRAMLSALDWVTGARTVTLTDTAAIETLSVSIVDSASADGPFAGVLDSSIVVNTEAFNQVVVSAPDTVTQGEDFWVDVALGDKFANPRLKDNRYVSITANKLGVQVPMGDHLISGGHGGFTANSGTFAGGGLVITVRDIVPAKTGDAREGTGDDFVDGQSASIYVAKAGEVVTPTTGVDRPDTLIVEDYMGADGAGDQGGFLVLTWDLSDDHSPGSGGVYRIYREVSVNYDAPGEGDESGAAIVALDSPSMVALPWAKVDMIPAEDVGRAIVATLDNVATKWFVAAEIGAATSASGKHVFSDVSSFLSPEALMAETMVPGIVSPAPVASAESPYELMAETMVASKQAGLVDPDAPVIATLTPEALAYVESGVALRLKGTDTEVRSSELTPSAEAVAAVDNIAPDPITYLRVLDTPGDAGASIDVLWTKSASDRLVPRSASGAVGRGGVGDLVSGVVGYNVYRKVGNEELILIGSAAAGETSFSDITALNGVRYTYQVSPFDDDNVAHSDLERTAMAIRNNVVDKSGNPIYGLFGPDQSVGFDDFFIFADFFGLDASSEDFDPAFDLSRNNKIDFDDFFVFADNFGRSLEAAGKGVPALAAGLNPEASLFLEAAADLPRVGEEMVIDVGLADFAELKGYGFTVNFDSDRLEFVKVLSGASLLGESELAQPHLVAQADGEVSVAAFGQTVDKGELDMRLVFRPTMEIEDSRIYFSEGQLRDGNYGVNQVERLGEVQIQTRPEVFALADNYPNPFNPETTIKYALPEAVDVRLDIYNMLGQMVRTMVAENQSPGRYVVRWNATDDSGNDLSTGIYFYRLRAGEFLETKKMLLLK